MATIDRQRTAYLSPRSRLPPTFPYCGWCPADRRDIRNHRPPSAQQQPASVHLAAVRMRNHRCFFIVLSPAAVVSRELTPWCCRISSQRRILTATFSHPLCAHPRAHAHRHGLPLVAVTVDCAVAFAAVAVVVVERRHSTAVAVLPRAKRVAFFVRRPLAGGSVAVRRAAASLPAPLLIHRPPRASSARYRPLPPRPSLRVPYLRELPKAAAASSRRCRRPLPPPRHSRPRRPTPDPTVRSTSRLSTRSGCRLSRSSAIISSSSGCINLTTRTRRRPRAASTPADVPRGRQRRARGAGRLRARPASARWRDRRTGACSAVLA